MLVHECCALKAKANKSIVRCDLHQKQIIAKIIEWDAHRSLAASRSKSRVVPRVTLSSDLEREALAALSSALSGSFHHASYIGRVTPVWTKILMDRKETAIENP